MIVNIVLYEYNDSFYKSKCNTLIQLFYELFEFKNTNPQIKSENQKRVYNAASRLHYNYNYRKTYFDEYSTIIDAEKKR